MAGELCSAAACGWCGRCDAWSDDVCDCGRADCRGNCDEFDANQEHCGDDTEDAA